MHRLPSRALRARHIIAAFAAAVLLGGCVSTFDLDERRPTQLPHRYVEIEGVRLHVEVSGSGPAVVLVHGFGGSTFSWRKIVPELSQDHRVITVDLPGFGYSDRPLDRAAYHRDAVVRRLGLLLDALGESQADWVGHSYGGGLLLALAAEHPERVRSLTLIDSTGPNYAIERHRLIAKPPPLAFLYVRGLGLRSNFVARVLRRAYADPQEVTPEVVAAYRDRLRFEGAARAYRHLSLRNDDVGSRHIELQEVTVPTLVIWGRQDRVLPLPLAEIEVAKLPNAAPIVALDACGHAPMEERPAAVLRHLTRFLAERADDTGERTAETKGTTDGNEET